VDAHLRDACARKLRCQGHCEAPGVSRADQLFRIGGRLAFVKSGLERIRPIKSTAADFQPPAAFGQTAFPFCFRFPRWYKPSFRLAPVCFAVFTAVPCKSAFRLSLSTS
jgi:hypothetical protein